MIIFPGPKAGVAITYFSLTAAIANATGQTSTCLLDADPK